MTANPHRPMRDFFSTVPSSPSLAIAVAILAPLGYILVLTALQLGAPLHAVAPAREMSMMIGALLGMTVLGERMSVARLGGSALIVIGVALLVV